MICRTLRTAMCHSIIMLLMIASLVFVLDSRIAKADSLPLSLDTVILLALTNNPDMNIVTEQVTQSEHAIDEAKSIYYPQVEFSSSVGLEYNDPAAFPEDTESTGTSNTNSSQDHSLQVNQLLFDGFASPEEVKRRAELLNSAEFQKLLVEEQVILEVIQAYLDVYHYQKAAKEADILIKRLSILKKKIDLMVAEGAENAAKQQYAQSRLSFAQSEKNKTHASLANALFQLEYYTGNLPDFEAVRPEMLDLLSVDIKNLFYEAFENNKSLLLNESDKKAIEHELKKVEGQYYPSVNLVMEYNKTNDVGGEIGITDTASALLQMNYKIFDGFARDATKKRVGSELKEASFKSDKIKRNIQQDLITKYNEMLSYEEDLIIVEEEIAANTELQKLYEEQFELGEGQIINIIEGEEQLYRSLVRKHQIEADVLYDGYELIHQIGHLDSSLFCRSCRQ